MLKVQVYGLKLVRERKLPFEATALNNSEASAKLICSLLKHKDREHLVVLAVDIQNCPVGLNIAHIGTLNATLASPREVFKFALLSNAAGVILGHNHPSGNLTPSPEDLSITRCLVGVGKQLEISVHDHIITTHKNRWASIRQTHPDLFY
ncbi:MAG TPA: JAB domain-containing protein [Thermodesulfobacteriota bacterium]|nr:JAB domain-containing protein [Thermodesulfobacteriota bacterium]